MDKIKSHKIETVILTYYTNMNYIIVQNEPSKM